MVLHQLVTNTVARLSLTLIFSIDSRRLGDLGACVRVVFMRMPALISAYCAVRAVVERLIFLKGRGCAVRAVDAITI